MADVELHAVQVEYEGAPVPLARPLLQAVQVEYEGVPVPLARPALTGLQLEYVYDPDTTTGPIQGGIVNPLILLSTMAGVPILSRITPADLLAYTEVSSDTDFDAESKWRYIVVQYLHRETGQIRNIHHRKNGAVWEGYFIMLANSAQGYWDKRSILIRALNEAELILHPTRFLDEETLVVRP